MDRQPARWDHSSSRATLARTARRNCDACPDGVVPVGEWRRPMILQKLEVDGFRCFDAMVTLVLDPHKINILHGNNGTGKSSLFSALLRGLLDSHKVGGKGIAELCPWGTQLSP